MVKLSQQLSERQQQPIRQTRTQRISQKQKTEREIKDFENLKAQANKKQEEMAGISFEEYEKEYHALSPNIQQFFSSPKEVLDQKAERIKTTKQTVQEKLAYADQKIEERTAYWNNKIRKREEWWGSKPSSYRNKENSDGEKYRKEKHKEKLNDYEDNLDEDIAKWKGYKKGLSKGFQELNANKDIAFSDIENYAEDVANYEESKEEARNEKRDFKRKQADEIKKLEEKGYSPQVIERSFKGNPTGVDLSYYNKATGDWKKVASFDTKGKIDVSKLNKVGYSQPTQRSLTFAGKDYKFSSRVGIYKEHDGDLVTPYERTGLNESVLIKQQQDKAFEEWQGSQKNKLKLPFRILESKDLPIGYGGQQTISDQPTSVLISEKDYFKAKDSKGFDFGIGKVLGGAKRGFKWVDERVHYTGDISLIKFGKLDKPTDPEMASQLGVDYLSKQSQKLEDWAIGKDKIEAFEKDLETKYSGEYQDAFEKKYMKSLIYNETDVETATKEFSESDEAKLIQRQYKEEYETGYEDLQISPSRLKKFGAGSGRVGLSLASLGLKAVGSPTKTALASGGAYTGIKLLSAIPSVVSYTSSGGLLAYGTYKAIDPKSTIDEVGSGLVTAVLSGATLGYAGYRHLKSPVIKTKIIKQPKLNLKASEVIGKDLKIITQKGTINKIVFENQKLSQTASAGRRTIVSTKGRVLANRVWRELGVPKKFTTFERNAIYKGVPTEQLGKISKITGLRGSVIVKQQSGYQKAFKLLQKYGWSDAQAKATLRYVAPRITDQYLSKGVLTVKGSKAVGEFEYLTKRPVVEVDKSLGIKTRGGKTIKDVYDVQRKLINIKKINVALEEKTKISMLLDKKGKLYQFTDDFAYSKGISVGKASKTQKGFEYVGKDVSGLDIFKEVKYKDLLRGSVETKLFPSDNIINVDFSKTKLFSKVIDLSKKNTYIKPINIKKTPFSKTFGGDHSIEKVIKKLSQNTATKDVSKVIDKLDDIGSPTKIQSKFYGSGKYEQSFGGLSPTQQQTLQQQLKIAPTPTQIKPFHVKDLIKVKNLDLTLSKVGQLSSIASMSELKSKIKLKSDLKVANQLKIKIAEDVMVKTAQLPALKSSPTLKSQLKTLLQLEPVMTGISPPTPSFKPPKIPSFRPPTPTPIVVLFPSAKGRGSNASLKKAISEVAYLPDFTSRTLGLKAEIITEKQAQAKLKKLLTGLEIRRGVKIK
ncbi:MAG: hypothetical protein DRN27_07725 [Thermoplasmata archaeon]|nr:MAG: hypothetical protein DRN27_07725 [Thermoplasmata archaeon]